MIPKGVSLTDQTFKLLTGSRMRVEMEFEKADIPNLKRIRALPPSSIYRKGEKISLYGPLAGSWPKISIVLFFLLFFISPVHGEELSAGDWSEMGNAQAKRGEYEEAVASYDRAIGLDAYNPDLWYNKGLALSNLGRYEDALYCYQRATNIKPFDADIWLSRGAALSGLGRYEEALESYDRAVEFDSEDADAWNNRGTVLAKLGRYEEAIHSYDRAIDLELEDADTWNNKGTILARLGRHEEALECYNRAIDLEPEDADAWNNKGSALHQLGRYQEALECYNRAIGLDPLHEYAWHNKGLLVPTLDDETEDAFALSRKRIYDETKTKTAPLILWDENAAVPNAGNGKENEKIPGWRVPLVIAAILVAGFLLNLGGKGRAFYIDSLQSSLSRLVLIGDRSLKRR